MLKLIKWTAVLVLLPILVLKEIYSVLKDSGLSIPEADEVLSSVQTEMKNTNSTPKEDTKNTADFSDKMDF